MPREIEFRCWSPKKKRWADEIEVFKDGSFTIGFQEENIEGVDGLKGTVYQDDDQAVLNEWTGLRDSKGVKVFEGDVVGKIRNDKIISYKIIKFDDFEETFYTDNFNSIAASEIYAGTCYYRGFNISKEEVCESIVMGNIYQNPELLEVKND